MENYSLFFDFAENTENTISENDRVSAMSREERIAELMSVGNLSRESAERLLASYDTRGEANILCEI